LDVYPRAGGRDDPPCDDVTVTVSLWGWFAAVGLILALLAVDLIVNRGNAEPTLSRALVASGAWIGVSISFGIFLGVTQGSDIAQQFFAGYVAEKSLSIDNIFVFVLLFRAFAVPPVYQHRVLYFGVIGALVARAAFIAAGAALLENFSWVLYIFGAFLLVAGIRMLRHETVIDPERNLVVRGVRRLFPITPDFVGERFFTHIDGRLFATPLFIALVAIETTDIVFATDSIPAIFGITQDVFVIFTSNAFAILGLRALYFVLADAMDRFRYLKYGLAALLIFIGAKLLLARVIHISITQNFIVIAIVISGAILASLVPGSRRATPPQTDAGTET
jgi:tellurite resistance protein TerC